VCEQLFITSFAAICYMVFETPQLSMQARYEPKL